MMPDDYKAAGAAPKALQSSDNIGEKETHGHMSVGCNTLIVFSFSSCFRFLLTLNAWLLVMLSLANLLLNTSLRTVSLETAQCAI